jgi:hypothetical protein
MQPFAVRSYACAPLIGFFVPIDALAAASVSPWSSHVLEILGVGSRSEILDPVVERIPVNMIHFLGQITMVDQENDPVDAHSSSTKVDHSVARRKGPSFMPFKAGDKNLLAPLIEKMVEGPTLPIDSAVLIFETLLHESLRFDFKTVIHRVPPKSAP